MALFLDILLWLAAAGCAAWGAALMLRASLSEWGAAPYLLAAAALALLARAALACALRDRLYRRLQREEAGARAQGAEPRRWSASAAV